MMAQSFEAQVAAWTKKVRGANEAIFKQSVQELVSVAQAARGEGGRMRVDTGFLRSSLMASTSHVPPINRSAKPVSGQSYAYSGAEITAVIAGAELGDTIFLGYTAAYAAHREFGARGQAPDAFVRTAAQQWPQVVARVTAELKIRLGL